MKVLVLGAGVIGTTTAWYLRQEGHEVTVIEREAAAAMETSFANGGQISGQVLDPSGAAVPNVEVSVRNKDTNYVRTGATDEAGRILVDRRPLAGRPARRRRSDRFPPLHVLCASFASFALKRFLFSHCLTASL